MHSQCDINCEADTYSNNYGRDILIIVELNILLAGASALQKVLCLLFQ